MRAIDIMRRAGRNLRQAKGRTILTSLAIGVGAFTLTLSMAAGEGARQYVDNLLKNNIDSQALFIVKDENITSNQQRSGLQEYSEDLGGATAASGRDVSVKMMNDNDLKKLNDRSDLDQVVPIYQLNTKYVKFGDNNKRYIAPVSYYDATIITSTSAGNLPKLGEQINDNEILVPESVADSLGVAKDKMIGQRIELTVSQTSASPSETAITNAFMTGGETAVQDLLKPQTKTFDFTVRAVTKKSAMSFAGGDSLVVSTGASKAIDEYTRAGTADAGKYIGVTALAATGKDPTKVKDSLHKEFGYTVQTAKEAQSLLFNFVNILQWIVAGFATLALIASVFGIINTQYISVLERTSQIGLMKALGMSRRDVAKLFRYEAAWIGFLGGALGALGACVIGSILNPLITKGLGLGEGQSLLIFVWWHAGLMIIGLIIVAIIAGWFPARKAARLDPIEALRTE